jgi:hypothetical protein
VIEGSLGELVAVCGNQVTCSADTGSSSCSGPTLICFRFHIVRIRSEDEQVCVIFGGNDNQPGNKTVIATSYSHEEDFDE